jgi:hypothetical protein
LQLHDTQNLFFFFFFFCCRRIFCYLQSYPIGNSSKSSKTGTDPTDYHSHNLARGGNLHAASALLGIIVDKKKSFPTTQKISSAYVKQQHIQQHICLQTEPFLSISSCFLFGLFSSPLSLMNQRSSRNRRRRRRRRRLWL